MSMKAGYWYPQVCIYKKMKGNSKEGKKKKKQNASKHHLLCGEVAALDFIWRVKPW